MATGMVGRPRQRPIASSLTHIIIILTFNTLMQQASQFLQPVATSKQTTEGNTHATTSSLKKGSPSSEVHVSRMPKFHTAKIV